MISKKMISKKMISKKMNQRKYIKENDIKENDIKENNEIEKKFRNNVIKSRYPKFILGNLLIKLIILITK